MAIRSLSLVLFLVLSLFSSSLSAVCDYVPFYSRPYRASALDLALDGNDLWVATSYGVMLYDAAPNPPVPRAGIAIPGTTNRVRVGTGVVYAASGTSIYVVRKDGRNIRNVRSLDLGATINDLLFFAGYLYAATATGIVQVDVVPDAPRIATRLATTTGQAFSLARLETTLYAADGDGSLEAYSIAFAALPQKIGTVSSLPRSSQILTTNNRLFVSDGTQTEIFSGSGTSLIRIGTLPARAVRSAFPSAGDAAFVAGSDRTVRAIDLANPSDPVTLFQFDLAPSPGTINRIEAMTGIAGRLYVAAGDIGVVTFNTEGFAKPFPVRTYSEPGLRSPIAAGSMVVAAGETGLRLFSVASDGSLLSLGTWDTQQRSTPQDSEGTLLLTSSGRSVTLWDLSQQPPRQVSTVMLRAPVRSAVLVDRTAVVLLDDKSVWKADLSLAAGTLTQQTVAGAPSLLARSGTSVVLGQVSNEDGKTTLRYYGSADLAAEPRVATLDGAATSGGVALSGSTAAVITFRGISLIDFAATAPAVMTLPSSASVIPRDLAFQGDTLFVLGPTSIQVWNTVQGLLQRTIDLGGDATSLAQRPIGGSILLAGESGLSSVQFQAATRLPSLVATYPNPNAFWRKLAVADSQLMLTDGRSIEVSRISDGRAPALVQRITAPSQVVDVTAVGSTIYTLNVNRTVTGFRLDGSSSGEIRIDESSDAVPLAMRNVAGALWVSFTKGCATGACERKTIILDPRSGTLVQTTSFAGELKDFSQVGTRVVALFDVPAELRIFDVTNPSSPTVTGSRPSEGNPVSVAWSAGQRAVYALGHKLYVYDETSLTKSGELLGTYQSDPTGRVTYVDQKVRISGGCALVAGRSYSLQLLSITGPTTWTPSPTPPIPAAVKSFHIEGTTVYLLTDYSLEVWSTNPRPEIRRRAVR